MMFLYLILAVSLVEYVGDQNFKKYARNGKTSNLVYGVIFYAFMIKLLIEALKKSNLIYMNGMWDGISTIIGTIFAWWLLKERLSNPMQWLGLLLIIMGLFALNSGKIPV
jgi:multidrug transporter EmrE-like cation transporter